MFQPTAQMPISYPEPSYPEPARTVKPRRWLRWAVPVLAFVIGVGVGNAGPQTDPTGTPQFQTLQGQLRSSQQEASQLSDEVDEAKAEIREAAAEAEAHLAKQTAELNQQAAYLEQERAEVATRAKKLRAREKAVRAAAQEAPEPAYAPAPAPVPVAEAPTSAYFGNCDAARAAGAAPVRVGDPGYGRHLDRDGDGVGCE